MGTTHAEHEAASDTGGPQAPAPEGAWVTQEDAAALCHCSYDTIRRYRRLKKLPRSRKSAQGAVEVPVVDLVACGLLDPHLAGGDPDALATRSRTERDLAAARRELAVLDARLEVMTVRAERAEHDVRTLHHLLDKSLGAK